MRKSKATKNGRGHRKRGVRPIMPKKTDNVRKKKKKGVEFTKTERAIRQGGGVTDMQSIRVKRRQERHELTKAPRRMNIGKDNQKRGGSSDQGI